METAKVFTNGASQAVRLPKSCRFDCEEVAVQKVGNMVMLFDQSKALENFLAMPPMDESFFDAIAQAREEDAKHPPREVIF